MEPGKEAMENPMVVPSANLCFCPNLRAGQEWGIVMFTVFLEHRLLSAIFLMLLLLSIVCQMVIGVIFKKMIKGTDNMAATANKRLKRCKLRFVNCYQLNGSVANVSVFVDKFLSNLTFMGMSLTGIQHLAGQLVLLSVVVAGIGVCQEIVQGEGMGKVLPYYIASFLGLYVYFSISGMIDVQGKRERLKISLVDYLENHMANKLRQSAIDWEGLTGERLGRKGRGIQAGYWAQEPIEDSVYFEPEPQQQQKAAGAENMVQEEFTGEEKVVTVFSRQEEQELEELLREFFT